MLQVKLLATDQLNVEHATIATAKNRQFDIPAPATVAALSDNRRMDELHLGTLGGGVTRQQVIGERQIVGHDLMESAYDHADFAEALRSRTQTGKLAQYGLDNPLTDREFVHPAKLADRKESVNKTKPSGRSSAQSLTAAQNRSSLITATSAQSLSNIERGVTFKRECNVETVTLESLLVDFSLFRNLDQDYMKLLSGCASNVRFVAREMIFRQGRSADHCYLIRQGRVSVEICSPHQGPVTIQTLGEGEVLGWSWLFPPYKWHFDARALELTRAIALDGVCLRSKCDQDPKLGYELMKRFSAIMHERMHAARLQIMDVYGPTSA